MGQHDYAIRILTARKIKLYKEQSKHIYDTFGWNMCNEHILKIESAIKDLKGE